MKNKLLLIIMDGYGLTSNNQFNAILKANTPHIDNIFKNNPTTEISASGIDVGLPDGQMGNSEVGHTNIGAGRVVYQDLSYINKSIQNGEFEKNKVLNDVMNDVLQRKSCLHIMGLLSDGGIHSHINHLFSLLKMAKNKRLDKVFIHVWTDGRDTNPKSAVNYINALNNTIESLKIGKIATVCGRFYSMDRDNNLERTKLASDEIVLAKGEKFTDVAKFVENSYASGITDEFILPGVLEGYKGVDKEDSVICFNFRPDRARQITSSIKNTCRNYVCFTQYDKSLKDVEIAFSPREIKNSLGEYLSSLNMHQLRVAETEKYAHVTFFFNAGVEKPYPNEDRIIVDSPKVKTYDLKPEMSAFEVTKKVLDGIKSNKYEFIVVNFANPDMVGHTGNFDATVKAVEAVDMCVHKLVEAANDFGMCTILTADHGNAEKMRDNLGNIFTSHTSNKVPMSVINYKCKLKSRGALCNIAPTICEIMGIPKPAEMESESLIKS